MKYPKIFHCRTKKTGPTIPVTLRVTHYTNNHSLAIQVITAAAPWKMVGVITVNIMMSGYIPKDMAYIDTNNCPWAEEFLKENGLAEDTGTTGISGFCEYPLYKIFLEKMYEEKQ